MTSVQPLYSITTSLQTCKTEKVEFPNPEDTCYVCMRTFGYVDDENDADELPCEAVRLVPCEHSLGNECLKLMIRKQGLTNCSHCEAPIKMSANPINRVMCWVLSNFYTRLYIDHALLVGSLFANWEDVEVSKITALHIREHQATLIQLSHRFFAQQLTWTDALRFWLYYMKLILISTLGVDLYIWLPTYLFTLLDVWYGAPIEVLVLSTLLGTDYKSHLSEGVMRMLVHAISNIGIIGTAIAVERQPHRHFKFGLMRGIASRREIMMILGCSSINLSRIVRSDVTNIVRLSVILAVLISYGLKWRFKI